MLTAIRQDIIDTMNAVSRKPSRLELVLNFCFWFLLATAQGYAAKPSITTYAPRDSSAWVINS